jgi:hypothetical protein
MDIKGETMMDTTCVCCGKEFKKLPELMAHMAENHTVEEVMAAVEADEKEKMVYSIEKNEG